MKNSLILKIYTVDKEIGDTECDSVLLPIADDEKGGFSGSYGIRGGHAKAVFSLAKGEIRAKRQEKECLCAEVSEGFAVVENDVVSVTVDRCEIKKR